MKPTMISQKLNPNDFAKRTLKRAGYQPLDPEIPGPSDPIEWIEAEFYIPETQAPITLHDYQRAVLKEAYRRDVAGRLIYSTVVWGDIKKSSKSTIAAAVALERSRRLKWGYMRIIANDLKQADSRVAEAMRKAIQLNPRLGSRIYEKKGIFRLPNYTKIEPVPIDPKGEAGGGDDLIIFSELWGADSIAADLMWTETTLSPLKIGQSQRWIETYAGFSGESVTLERLYDQGVKEGRLLDLGIPGLEVYANDTARLLCLWNTIKRCSWQLGEQGALYYAQESSTLTPSEFARVHENEWQYSEQKFIDDELWAACGVATLPVLDKYREVVVSLDAAVSNDCFGITALSRSGDNVIKRFARKWTPPKGGKLQYTSPSGDKNDMDYPEGVIRWLAREFNVIVFGYDETQLHHLCTSLATDGVGIFMVFPQGAQRLEADKQLFDVIRERRIIHDNDIDLTEHIRNANRKEDPQSRQLRIVKRKDDLKIDLAVSLSMTTWLAFKYLSE